MSKIEIAPKHTELTMSYEDAVLYCLFLNIDGKVGWRLPTLKELIRISKKPSDFEKTWYLSSTLTSDATLSVVNTYDFSTKNQFSRYLRGQVSMQYAGNTIRPVRDLC